MADSDSQNQRKDIRRALDESYTEVQTASRSIPARISDLSEGGMRLVLPEGYSLDRGEEVTIAVGKVVSHIKGRVRWVQQETDPQDRLVTIGVQFDGFVVEPRKEDEIQDLLDAWRDISQTYSTYDSFLHILQIIDLDILDGKIDNLSDAVHSLVAWLDQRMGPLNVWSLIREPNNNVLAKPLVERHAPPDESSEVREGAVRDVAIYGVTTWVRGRPYLLAGDIVVEYMGTAEGKIDLIQKLAAVMSTRVSFWSKLLIKNLALELLGDQVEKARKG